MITNGEGQHCLSVKKLSALLRGITSKYHGDFYCLICLHSFATERKLKSHKKACENKDFCNAIMSSKDPKTFEFNRDQKTDKATFTTYGDLECIIEKADGCKNYPENSSTTKVSEHILKVFQYLQYPHLEAQKISMMYTDAKIV